MMLTFVGDILLPPAFHSSISLSDSWVGNLEGALAPGQQAIAGKIALRSEPVELLAGLGRLPVALGLANNHIMDFGVSGCFETVRSLSAAGIQVFGAGMEADNYRNPLVLTCSGHRIALIGYAANETNPLVIDGVGPAPLSLDRVARDARNAHDGGADRVVAFVHWGTEECDLPAPSARLMARTILTKGVDLIVGHHSHCVQPHEAFDGRRVYYGIGNFIMPDIASRLEGAGGGSGPRVYRKRQMGWNQRSIVVDWDPASGAFRESWVRFRRGRLDRGRPRAYPAIPEDERIYAIEHRRAVRRARWRRRLALLGVGPAAIPTLAVLAGRRLATLLGGLPVGRDA